MTEDKLPCRVFRVGETYEGKQGFSYFSGISAESAGASGICMHLLDIPPGGRAKAHMHAAHETAIYVLEGEGQMWWGAELSQHMILRAGDMLLLAGQFDQYGEEVQADTPQVLPAFGDRPRNRLGLAQWLLSDENPLMARVTVNRVWQQFFGMGLVKTPDNLGLQAEVPSHPLLLDWLAADFRNHKWDTHHLIRTIVLSATYRQSSKHRPPLEDPDNRLLARGPSFRLPAEMIRDQALAASGLLVLKIGGPSVKPYQPDGIWEDLNAPASHAEVYQQSSGADLYRKSMYTFWRRAAMHPAMSVFDAPNRDVCNVKREATNTPLQALALMHDPTYIEAARKLAEQVIAEQPGDATAQIALALRRTLSREPTEQEADLLGRLYRMRLACYKSDKAAAMKLLSVGASPVDTNLDAARVAALADVALAIFNLSEAITRK